jgi:hypothetical protein
MRDAQEEPMLPEVLLLLLLFVEEEGVEPIVPVRGVREEVVVDWLVVVARGSSKVLRSAVRGGEG